MKIYYVSTYNALDVHQWSGIPSYFLKMLSEAGFNPNYLHHVKPPIHKVLYNRVLNKFRNDYHYSQFEIKVSQECGNLINQTVGDGDYLFSPNSVMLAFVKNSINTILYSDATFNNLVNFYPAFSSLSKKSLTEGHELERLAIQKASLLIYTSKWAAQSAIQDYGGNPDRTHILPFGANLDMIPDETEIHEIINARDLQKEIKLLFVGLDWKRKGGETALDVVGELNRNGIKASLHVMGMDTIPPHKYSKYCINHGFLSKKSPDAKAKMHKILSDCSLLILPTNADCTPVAFSEANAFGLPCITTDIGGIESVISNGINGYTIPYDGFCEKAIAYILRMREGNSNYKHLAYSSYSHYKTNLNWQSTAIKFKNLVDILT